VTKRPSVWPTLLRISSEISRLKSWPKAMAVDTAEDTVLPKTDKIVIS